LGDGGIVFAFETRNWALDLWLVASATPSCSIDALSFPSVSPPPPRTARNPAPESKHSCASTQDGDAMVEEDVTAMEEDGAPTPRQGRKQKVQKLDKWKPSVYNEPPERNTAHSRTLSRAFEFANPGNVRGRFPVLPCAQSFTV